MSVRDRVVEAAVKWRTLHHSLDHADDEAAYVRAMAAIPVAFDAMLAAIDAFMAASDATPTKEDSPLVRIVAMIEGWQAAGEVPAEEFIAFLLDEVRNELKG